MRLSYDWLSDFVELDGLTPEEVAEKLTMGAFEVEEIRQFGVNLQGKIVVGEIMEILPHPDPAVTKMRLTKTRVADGQAPLEIVCGAWNIEPGQRIPVALPGSVVVNRKDGGAFPIEETSKRGVTSYGMLCAPQELGMESDVDGILILDSKTPIGKDIKELLNIKPDTVFHVEPRSNRGDALCVLGLAREVAALCQRPLKFPKWDLGKEEFTDTVTVNSENLDDCPFFTIRVLDKIAIGPAPPFMVRRLEAAGIRSVNNVVDITNYVLQELGQPLHAYDLAKLAGNRLETRRAKSGEKLLTLDDKERSLDSDILVIADGQAVVGVAGVMGGKGTEISDSTSRVALEAASFAPAVVRRTSRRLGLASDSSMRFERGVDRANVQRSSDRAAALMIEHCGARLGKLSTAGSGDVKPMQVTLSLSQLDRLTELKVTSNEVNDLLSPLGFKLVKTDADKLSFEIPSFRTRDVTREIDLIEEVTRLYGYDRVPVSMPKRMVAPPLPDRLPRTIRQSLSAVGLNEAWMSSLVSIDDLTAKCGIGSGSENAVTVQNPLSDEHQALRTSLMPGLIKAVAHNQDHGVPDVWLFEIGRTYRREPGAAISGPETGTSEIPKVAAIITGDPQLGQWTEAVWKGAIECPDFYVLKGLLENLVSQLGIPGSNVAFRPPQEPTFYHPGRSAEVVYQRSVKDTQTKILGHIGEIHPAVAEAYGLKKPACAFELDINQLKAVMADKSFKAIHTTPPVVRDITADVDKATNQSAVRQVIAQVGTALLRQVDLVSTFDLSADKRSLSYRLTFQRPDQTLTAEEVDKLMTKIREQLTRQLSASFRV